MAPKKNDPNVKDLRAFFGGGGKSAESSQKTDNGKGASSAKPIELISDSDDAGPSKKPAAVKKSTTSASTSALKRKSHVLLSESDSEPAPVPKKKPTASSSTSTPRAPPKTAPPPIKVEKPKAQPSSSRGKQKSRAAAILTDSEVDEDSDPFEPDSDEDAPKAKSASKPKPKSPAKKSTPAKVATSKGKSSKRSRDDSDEDEDDAVATSDEDVKPTKKKARPSNPAPAKASSSSAKSKPAAASSSKPSTSASGSKSAAAAGDKPKAKWIPPAAKGPPPAAGSKAVPEGGDPNALAGLTIVFTGELSAFSREEAAEIVNRFGGRVTGQPSGKTSYVVLGRDAGPKKLEIIKKLGVPTLDEDGLLNLIATRKGKLDEKQLAKQKKDEEKLKADAKELAKRDKEAKANGVDPKTQLWTSRYAPQTMKEIVGNRTNAEKIQQWLHDWPNSLKSSFKKPGPNGLNCYRALLISGPPGIGKTTSAHVAAKVEGYTPIELNASDARSKKLVESSTNISNTSLDGWMGGSGDATTVAGFKVTDRTVLIMDEVDGMSGGDRGGIGALNALIKKTRIPIICIANDRRSQKIKPLTSQCYNMSFTKPNVAQVRSRMMTIATREKIKLATNVMDSLIEGANSDIRQVLNMLSTWKLSHNDMDFDQGKQLARANQKHLLMTPYTILDKLFGPYTFSETSRETLNDKMDYYFQDHMFIPLFVQENYTKTTPARLRNLPPGPESEMKHLELLDKAASSMSDGDLVDTMIHRQTQWSLMPLHAVTSTVRPAYHLYGKGLGYGFKENSVSFPSWLGQNSKEGKLRRQLAEVQIRMRLKVSGDKAEIRQHYLPALFPQIVQPLMSKNSGSEEVDDAIERMDEYYISKDDWDTIVELGVGDWAQDIVQKKIPTATKTALTRKYNSTDHPIPFHKATDLGSKIKKIAKSEMPDQEDVLDNEDDIADEEPVAGGADEESDYDVGKDKLIKQAKAKAGAGKSKAKAPSGSGTKGKK